MGLALSQLALACPAQLLPAPLLECQEIRLAHHRAPGELALPVLRAMFRVMVFAHIVLQMLSAAFMEAAIPAREDPA
jgi:hypothetical protein